MSNVQNLTQNQEIHFSVIIPTFKRPKYLRRAIETVINQTYQNFTLYVIGDHCPYLEIVMRDLYKDLSDTLKNKVIWHNLKENHGSGGAGPRNWALQHLVTSIWVAYLDDDNFYKPNHLMEVAWLINKCSEENHDISFVCTNFEIERPDNFHDDETAKQIVECNKPCKGRVDTSSVIHKRDLIDKYGGWKSQAEVGYSNDWDLFSRWIDEPYACTNESTMVYNLEFNHQTYESILSGLS